MSIIYTLSLYANSSQMYPYFETIPTLSREKVLTLKNMLVAIDQKGCQEINRQCKIVNQLFENLWGSLKNPTFPKLLVYINKDLEIRTNLLVWNNKVTPYLFGAQNILVTVFSESKLDLQVNMRVLSDSTTGKDSSVSFNSNYIENVYVHAVTNERSQEDKRIKTKSVILKKIGHSSLDQNLWFGVVPFFLKPETANQISIYPQSMPSRTKEAVAPKGETTANFLLTEANFTNSRDNRVGFSIAIGATLDVEEDDRKYTHLESTNLDFYGFFHLFLIRPTLTAPILDTSYLMSVSVVVGTSLTSFFEKDELIFGLCFAHILAKNGFIVGINIMDPFEQKESSDIFEEKEPTRKTQPFLAFDIMF